MAQTWLHPELAYHSAKVEGTYGTNAAGLPSTDGILVRKADMKIGGAADIMIERRRETFAAPGVHIGPQWWELEIEVPLAGPDPTSGALALPEVHPLLLASGFAYTAQDIGTTGSTNRHLYEPSSKGAQVGLTFDKYRVIDGGTVQLQRALGCLFSPKLTFPAEGEAYWTFSGKGLWTADTNPAAPAASVFLHPGDAVIGKSATLSLYARTDHVSEMTIEWGHEVVARPSLSAASGIAGFRLKLGQPKITINPEMISIATFDRMAAVLAETLAATSISVPTLDLAKWVFTAAESQIGRYELEDGEVTKVATVIYPRDTAAGEGDDSLSFYCQRLAAP